MRCGFFFVWKAAGRERGHFSIITSHATVDSPDQTRWPTACRWMNSKTTISCLCFFRVSGRLVAASMAKDNDQWWRVLENSEQEMKERCRLAVEQSDGGHDGVRQGPASPIRLAKHAHLTTRHRQWQSDRRAGRFVLLQQTSTIPRTGVAMILRLQRRHHSSSLHIMGFWVSESVWVREAVILLC
jgi:hypothetical protein